MKGFVTFILSANINKNYFKSDWLYLIPIVLLVYSLIMWIFGDNELQTNIKRIYYTFFLFLYLMFMKHVDVTKWCNSGPFGISPAIWSILLSLLVAFLIALIIDNFIISGYVFTEFGIFGAKFIKEETKRTVDVQHWYLLNLEKCLEALYDIFFYMYTLFNDPQIVAEIKEGTFDYPLHFTKILNNYYLLKSEFVHLNVKFYKTDKVGIKAITEDFAMRNRLNLMEKLQFKAFINNQYGGSKYYKLNNEKIFIITAKVKHSKEDEMLMITIRSEKEINVYDLYPILSFLNYFELEISKL